MDYLVIGYDHRIISILVLTKNEEKDLRGCLASVAWSDDIHVFDSYSTDATVPIAQECGARVTQRVFDDYATQRNASLHLAFKYDWVLILDADERPTPELSNEIQQVLMTAAPTTSGFRLRRRDFLFGTWLKHAQISPFYVRLVRPERARYTRTINEVISVSGAIDDLVYPLDHFPFSKGITQWINKHNFYSSLEAELIYFGQGLQNPSLKTAVFNSDFQTRRLHQKAIFYRLPGRPVVKWIYMMLVRRAFLDGYAGLTYSTLQTFYEYLIVLKVRELTDKEVF